MNNCKKLFFIFIFGLCAIFSGFAQQHSIDLNPGFYLDLFKDDAVSPVSYRSPGVGFSLAYEFRTADDIHRAGLTFSLGEAKRIEPRAPNIRRYIDPETDELMEFVMEPHHQKIDVGLFYSWHRQVLSRGIYSLSPGIRLDYTFNANLFDYPTINSVISLSPSIHQEFRFTPDQVLDCTVKVPLANYVLRPPFAGVDDDVLEASTTNPLLLYKNGFWATVDRYFAFDFSVNYRYRFLPWLEGSLGVQSGYRYTDGLKPRREFQVHISPGARILF